MSAQFTRKVLDAQAFFCSAIGDAAYVAACMKGDDLERRALELKEKSEVIGVSVLKAHLH